MAKLSKYKLELSEEGKLSFYKGNDLEDIFETMVPILGKVKSKSVLKVSTKDKTSEIVLYPRFLKRLIVNKITRQILKKRLSMALGTW